METISFEKFCKEYLENLKPTSCIPPCLEEMCGGWTQETFKQVVQKLTKKNTCPLPLWFDDPKNMEIISIKKEAVSQLFKLLDTRSLGRIDAYEMFAVIVIMVEGNISLKLANICEVFGGENANSINRDEFYYFIDSLIRGLCKILLRKGETNPAFPNRRLDPVELQDFVGKVFKINDYLLKDEFVENISHVEKLKNMLEMVSVALERSLKVARFDQIIAVIREEALKNMKIGIEVKKCLLEMILKVEKELKPGKP